MLTPTAQEEEEASDENERPDEAALRERHVYGVRARQSGVAIPLVGRRDGIDELAEAFDFGDHGFSRLQPAPRRAAESNASRRAGADNVAWLERGDGGDVGDQLGRLKMSSRVLECCRISPPIESLISRLCGSRISSAVTIVGPIGQKVSKLYPASIAMWPVGRRAR